MKNLLITSDFPPILGGISTVFYNIWKYLPAEFIVLAPAQRLSKQFDHTLNMRIFRPHVPIGDNIFKKILRAFIFLFCSLSIAATQRICYVQAGQPMIPGMIAVVIKKFLKIPFMVWVYGGEVVKYRDKRVLYKILRRVLDEADIIVANSEFTRRVYELAGIPEQKIVTITPAVDADVFAPGLDIRDLQVRYSLAGKRVLLTVARLSQRKGHDTVIRALSALKDDFADIVYLIVGTGPDEKRLRSLIEEYGVSDRVIFCGAVADEDLPLYYNLCDIHVMPNRQVEGADTLEGFGLSFIEAGACAKPVIGGRSGGSCEAVLDGETGFLIEPLDEKALAQKLSFLLSDKEAAARMGESGRKRAMDVFRWQDRAQMLKTLLQRGKMSGK